MPKSVCARPRFSLCVFAFVALLQLSWAVAQEAERPALPNYPLDVAVDADGNAFVVDRNMHGVWKYDGSVSAFFEGSAKFRTPLNAARSIALDQEGNLLVGDTSTRDIYRFDENGKATPITGGAIGIPMDIAVKKDGTIYVADLELRSLLRIPAGSGEVETVAAVNPRGVFIDADDQIWVVSQNAQQLQIVADDGSVEVIVDSRVFEFPHQVVVNSKGEAFVTDGYRKAIWKVVKGSSPEVVFEGEPLVNPVGICIKDDELYVTDPKTRTVYKLDADFKPEAWFTIDQ